MKTTFLLTVDAKYRLSTLKAELRKAGHAATEAGIVELLIESADAKSLAAAYRKAARAT